jgi:hypothetical protein
VVIYGLATAGEGLSLSGASLIACSCGLRAYAGPERPLCLALSSTAWGLVLNEAVTVVGMMVCCYVIRTTLDFINRQ